MIWQNGLFSVLFLLGAAQRLERQSVGYPVFPALLLYEIDPPSMEGVIVIASQINESKMKKEGLQTVYKLIS